MYTIYLDHSHHIFFINTCIHYFVWLYSLRLVTDGALFFLMKTCCDCSADGHYILTCSNGFNASGCEATVSTHELQALKTMFYLGYCRKFVLVREICYLDFWPQRRESIRQILCKLI